MISVNHSATRTVHLVQQTSLTYSPEISDFQQKYITMKILGKELEYPPKDIMAVNASLDSQLENP